MGLDMNAMKVRKGYLADDQQVDFELTDNAEVGELQYWRKRPNLHGWMQKLYVEKGGKSADPSDFNCVPVRLMPEDLDRLETDIKGQALPHTTGFFFGQSYGTEEERAEDLRFVAEARVALADGWDVFYDSWW